MRPSLRLFLLCLVLLGITAIPGMSPSLAQGLPALIEGRAISVADGDTFTLLDTQGRRWRVRLAGIDAPESAQPWADRSRLQLTQWLADRPIFLEPVKIDPFGRLVARTRIPSPDSPDELSDAGLLLVQAGLAWHFKRYKSDQSAGEYAAFASAEQQARQSGRGLWSDPQPEAPWTYRERQRAARR